jgi:hypothetical protein
MFGAIYADTYLLHRRDITFSRLRHDIVFAGVLTAAAVVFTKATSCLNS